MLCFLLEGSKTSVILHQQWSGSYLPRLKMYLDFRQRSLQSRSRHFFHQVWVLENCFYFLNKSIGCLSYEELMKYFQNSPYLLRHFFLNYLHTPFPGDTIIGPLISVNNSIWQAAANSFHVLMINQTSLFTNASECIRNIR